MNTKSFTTLILVLAMYLTGCATQSAREYMQNGITFYKQKLYQGAVEHFEKAIALDRNLADIYYHRGNVYRDWNQQYDLAIADYTKAIDIKDDYLEAYTYRADVYKRQSKYDESLRDYQRIIELNPNQPTAYYNLALIYKEYYDKNNEIKYLNQVRLNLDKAMQNDPQNVSFYKLNATLHILEKDYAKALDDYNKILEQDRQDYRTLMHRGIAYFNLKEYTKAFNDFQTCEANGFQDAQIHGYVVKCMQLQGKNK